MKPSIIFCVLAAAATALACDENSADTDEGGNGADVLVADSVGHDSIDSGSGDTAGNDTGVGDSFPADSASETDDGPRLCHDQTDCDMGMSCFAPGEPNCGICMEPEPSCSTDQDCQSSNPGTVCDYVANQTCMCSNGRMCVIPCNQEGGYQCDPVAQECDAGTGKCVKKVCSDSSSCPDLFECPDRVAQPVCTRMSCGVDIDCPNGWCVKGRCFDTPGTCDYMAP